MKKTIEFNFAIHLLVYPELAQQKFLKIMLFLKEIKPHLRYTLADLTAIGPVGSHLSDRTKRGETFKVDADTIINILRHDDLHDMALYIQEKGCNTWVIYGSTLLIISNDRELINRQMAWYYINYLEVEDYHEMILQLFRILLKDWQLIPKIKVKQISVAQPL